MRFKLAVWIVALLMTWVLGASAFAAADTPKDSKQTICPVMAGTIDKNIYADHNGKRVYFCCSGCLEEFKKDPDKYIKEMEAKGIQLEKTP